MHLIGFHYKSTLLHQMHSYTVIRRIIRSGVSTHNYKKALLNFMHCSFILWHQKEAKYERVCLAVTLCTPNTWVQMVTLLTCIWEVPTYPDQAFCWFFSVWWVFIKISSEQAASVFKVYMTSAPKMETICWYHLPDYTPEDREGCIWWY